jgi:hypothetical protein
MGIPAVQWIFANMCRYWAKPILIWCGCEEKNKEMQFGTGTDENTSNLVPPVSVTCDASNVFFVDLEI